MHSFDKNTFVCYYGGEETDWLRTPLIRIKFSQNGECSRCESCGNVYTPLVPRTESRVGLFDLYQMLVEAVYLMH